jgi:hypothetical protein
MNIAKNYSSGGHITHIVKIAKVWTINRNFHHMGRRPPLESVDDETE